MSLKTISSLRQRCSKSYQEEQVKNQTRLKQIDVALREALILGPKNFLNGKGKFEKILEKSGEESFASLEGTERNRAVLSSLRVVLKESIKNRSLRVQAEKVEMLAIHLFSRDKALLADEILGVVSKKHEEMISNILASFPEEEKAEAKNFIAHNPKFLSVAARHFWHKLLPTLKLQEQSQEDRPYYMEQGTLKVRAQRKDDSFKSIQWKTLEKEFDKGDYEGKSFNYRLLQKGLARGVADAFESFEPLMQIDTQGRCVFQSVSSLLRRAPFSLVEVANGNTGHSFAQLMIPQKDGKKSDLYSFGLFPKNFKELQKAGMLSTVPGVYQSPDPHSIRISDPDNAKGYRAIVEEYEIFNDAGFDACLIAYATKDDIDSLIHAVFKRDDKAFNDLRERLEVKKWGPKPEKDSQKQSFFGRFKALFARKEEEAERVAKDPIHCLDKREKALFIFEVIEKVRQDRSFQLTGGNCALETNWYQRLATDFLGAKLHVGQAVKVYTHQQEKNTMKMTWSSYIFDRVARVAVMIASYFPATGAGKSYGEKEPLLKVGQGSKIFVKGAPTVQRSALPKKKRLQRVKIFFQGIYNWVRGRDEASA